ncbi:Hfm1 homolog [Talaromyces pinophilus]|uniref:DNA 3'-5' helicase n=1 Tax=Talaromyces pinophilus TaxID=128442 RepID=A0A510NWT1_TALPI|nr:Hfm1 homolog [Talaromyces pinophilus]
MPFGPQNPFLSMEDDDIPLDTFDRELLAQLGEQDLRPAATAREGLLHRFTEDSVSPESPAIGQFSSSPDTSFQSSPLLRYFRPSQPRIASTPGFSEYQKGLSTSPSLPHQISFNHAPPVVQGIHLIETKTLPDRFRALFPYPLFNAVQSKCFPHVYGNDYNVVVSAPTGSGKTVIMELAICRLVNNLKDGLFKLVYQAPTRALCSERFRDWSNKFTSLGLQCAELTGDTDYAQSRLVQTASIIITTPEKWDSMTRRWRDHSKLMQLVRLFLIDEVHVLNETRGAALEAVVSRMKSVGSNVRFIALSATIPNSEDIATWLGKNDTLQHLPAHKEHFGEEFRPTKLQKFVYGYPCTGNDFAFDRLLGSKLPEIISKHSNKKPMMIFCCTRNSAISTAKELAKLWSNAIPQRRLWAGPVRMPVVKNTDLKALVASGVAFHHAGLDSDDRHAVEKAFLEGKLSIICCTSTLAVGVNLPCYLVIIKNTVCWQEGGCKEYTDLEMMQMLGRAGRPQFDDTAVAVILTKKERVPIYEQLVSGTMQLESCLHLNLIDHLNAEISLGTVSDIQSAIKWLAGTFLFVRLRRNPTRYKLKENADRRDEDEMLQQICDKDIKLLQETELVVKKGPFKATPYGEAMAKYYVKFETMKIILALPPRAKISEILSAISQAQEFHELRLKAAERPFYRELNRAHGIRFPIKVELVQNAHKISLLVQAELAAVDFPSAEQFQKHKLQVLQDKAIVFNHINRLIRCIIDCQIHNEDGVAVRNCLELARSFASRVWENSPLQMKQIDQIGVVAVRKLAGAGITSIQELEETEAHKIDMILSKNPPFGMKLLARLAEFPKLRVTIKMLGKASKHGGSVRVNFKADIGFLNEKTPTTFHKRPVYVCFLAELSDGRLLDFRRLSAQKLLNDQEILLSAEIKSPLQHITCYVMCDEIGGTCQYAELKPDVPDYFFSGDNSDMNKPLSMNTSRRRNGDGSRQKAIQSEAFEDDDIPDDAFLEAAHGFDDHQPQQRGSVDTASSKGRKNERRTSDLREDTDEVQPVMLENGKYNCNHKCKDKSTCKHFCCREGLDKPPKIHKNARHNERTKSNIQLPLFSNGSQKTSNKVSQGQGISFDTIDYLDLTQPTKEKQQKKHPVRDSKAARMGNLDFASSQAALPKATAGTKARSRKRSNTRRRRSSSEYYDSSLDEFFSPIRPTSNTVNGADSPTVDTGLELDDDIDRIMGLGNTSPSNNVQSSFTSTVSKTLGPRDTLSYNAPRLSSFDKENTQTQVLYKSLVSEPQATLTKRKVELLSDSTNIGNASKHPKTDTQPSSVDDANASHDPFNELQTHSTYQPESQNENIDALLLQEFGDIVNFSGI